MLFYSPTLAIIFIVIELILGGGIGIVAVVVAYRSRINRALLARAALLGGVVFLVVMAMSGWAGSHAAFYNGKRMDVAPWGENLWLRNRLADYGGVIGIVGSASAGLLAGASSTKRKRV